MKKILLLLTSVASVSVGSLAHADILTSYSFNTTASPNTYDTGIDPATQGTAGANSIIPTTTATGVASNDLALGAGGDAYWAHSHTYAGFGFGPFAAQYPTDLAGAVATDLGYDFTVAPTAGNTLTLTSLDLSSASIFSNSYNNNGARYYGDRTFYLESSLTGSTVLGSFSVDYTGNVTAGSDDFTLGSAFADLTGPVAFSIYVVAPSTTANNGDGGTDFPPGVDSDYPTGLTGGTFTVNGSVAATPEPGTYALLGLGLAALVVTLRHRRASQV